MGYLEDKYTKNEKGYYITKEIFSGLEQSKCPICPKRLNHLYSEKYMEYGGGLIIMGVKIHGYECTSKKHSIIKNKDSLHPLEK